MKKIKISDYGIRWGYFGLITAGKGSTNCLHIPKHPTMKHSFTKMLWLIRKNLFKTRKEIIEFSKMPLSQLILSYGGQGGWTMNPNVNDYWAELHRKGYIYQWREGKRIIYELTEKGWNALHSIPENEKEILGI